MNALFHQGSSERELPVPSDKETEQCANDTEILNGCLHVWVYWAYFRPTSWPQLLVSQALTLHSVPVADCPLSLLTETQRPGEACPDLGDSQMEEPGRAEEKEMEMSNVGV